MAQWVRLSSLCKIVCLARLTWTISLLFMPPSNFGDGWHNFRKHSKAAYTLVSSYLVRYEPKKRRKCHKLAANTWTPQLSNRMDMVA
jgi:hypothetical protein